MPSSLPTPLPSANQAHDFEAMFSADGDPWRFRTRWYEIRKRALTLACLPQQHYRRGFEPGCANGELSAALAGRCDSLLVCDGALHAVGLARARLRDLPHVEVRRALLPQGWPGAVDGSAARFDLIVISELAYYLEPIALAQLIAQARAALLPGGTLLACHWRRPIEGCLLDGDAVHLQFHRQLQLPHLLNVLDADLRLDVWQNGSLSVAQSDGLT